MMAGAVVEKESGIQLLKSSMTKGSDQEVGRKIALDV